MSLQHDNLDGPCECGAWHSKDDAPTLACPTHFATGVFLEDVSHEVRAARAKFPNARATLAALMEEVGELANALLDKGPWEIYEEAIQVAAVAARIATEGDRSLDEYRALEHKQPLTGYRGGGRR